MFPFRDLKRYSHGSVLETFFLKLYVYTFLGPPTRMKKKYEHFDSWIFDIIPGHFGTCSRRFRDQFENLRSICGVRGFSILDVITHIKKFPKPYKNIFDNFNYMKHYLQEIGNNFDLFFLIFFDFLVIFFFFKKLQFLKKVDFLNGGGTFLMKKLTFWGLWWGSRPTIIL